MQNNILVKEIKDIVDSHVYLATMNIIFCGFLWVMYIMSFLLAALAWTPLFFIVVVYYIIIAPHVLEMYKLSSYYKSASVEEMLKQPIEIIGYVKHSIALKCRIALPLILILPMISVTGLVIALIISYFVLVVDRYPYLDNNARVKQLTTLLIRKRTSGIKSA